MTPQLTELERVKMENFALRYNYMQMQLQQIAAERQDFIKQIVAAHPGCEWDEQAGLVEMEEEQPAATMAPA